MICILLDKNQDLSIKLLNLTKVSNQSDKLNNNKNHLINKSHRKNQIIKQE
jgi:hypothetical protein